MESQYDVRMSGNFLMIYMFNFHVLNHLLLIYICKLHWNHLVKLPSPGIALKILKQYLLFSLHRKRY